MVLEKTLGDSLGLQGDQTRKSVLNIHWKDWCWSWSSNTLVIWCKELSHWKRPWCLARLKTGGEGDNRGRDGWMASPTQWTWVWARSGSWWWTGKPGVLQYMGSQRVRHNWATEMNWTLEFGQPIETYKQFNYWLQLFASPREYNFCLGQHTEENTNWDKPLS